jgi:hypothetical protein
MPQDRSPSRVACLGDRQAPLSGRPIAAFPPIGKSVASPEPLNQTIGTHGICGVKSCIGLHREWGFFAHLAFRWAFDLLSRDRASCARFLVVLLRDLGGLDSSPR